MEGIRRSWRFRLVYATAVSAPCDACLFHKTRCSSGEEKICSLLRKSAGMRKECKSPRTDLYVRSRCSHRLAVHSHRAWMRPTILPSPTRVLHVPRLWGLPTNRYSPHHAAAPCCTGVDACDLDRSMLPPFAIVMDAVHRPENAVPLSSSLLVIPTTTFAPLFCVLYLVYTSCDLEQGAVTVLSRVLPIAR